MDGFRSLQGWDASSASDWQRALKFEVQHSDSYKVLPWKNDTNDSSLKSGGRLPASVCRVRAYVPRPVCPGAKRGTTCRCPASRQARPARDYMAHRPHAAGLDTVASADSYVDQPVPAVVARMMEPDQASHLFVQVAIAGSELAPKRMQNPEVDLVGAASLKDMLRTAYGVMPGGRSRIPWPRLRDFPSCIARSVQRGRCRHAQKSRFGRFRR